MAAYIAPYARALAEVVTSAHLDVNQIDSQLEDFSKTLSSSASLREVLYNPSFPMERRLAVLDQISARIPLSKEVRNFIAVLMRNGRLHGFDEVLGKYRSEIDKRSGIAEALITTARPLDKQEQGDLERQAEKLAGKKVHASFSEDKDLIGGVVLRIGSTVYDGSVRGRLQRLKDQLIAG